MDRRPAGIVWGLVLVAGFGGCEDPHLAAGRKSDGLFHAAAEAQKQGDHAKALDLFSQAIATRPSGYAYLGRAKLYLEMKDDAHAAQDVEAGLQLDPEHRDLIWLRAQLKKPERLRFKGAEAQPPSASK